MKQSLLKGRIKFATFIYNIITDLDRIVLHIFRRFSLPLDLKLVTLFLRGRERRQLIVPIRSALSPVDQRLVSCVLAGQATKLLDVGRSFIHHYRPEQSRGNDSHNCFLLPLSPNCELITKTWHWYEEKFFPYLHDVTNNQHVQPT